MNSSRRQICGQSSKKQSRKNSTISKIVQYRCKSQNSHTPDKHRGYGCFWLYKVSKMGLYQISFILKRLSHFLVTTSISSSISKYYKPCQPRKLRFLGRGLAPYKNRDNTACLRVNSHNPHCPYFCMACSFRECSQRESNPQLVLRSSSPHWEHRLF